MADLGVRGIGASKARAFEAAALALTAALAEPSAVATTTPVAIKVSAPDDELLLVDWLNALIYEMAVSKMLFARFHVEIEGDSLKATAWGEPMDAARHHLGVEVKGATLTELKVAEDPPGHWIAQCVIDV
jgi:SHS2 domain-containing protein